jgi:hypothetical protein
MHADSVYPTTVGVAGAPCPYSCRFGSLLESNMTTLMSFCFSLMFLMAGAGSTRSMQFAIMAVTIGIVVDLAKMRHDRIQWGRGR